MASKKTLLLLGVLLVLAVAAYFFTKKGDQRTTLDIEETAFTVTDTAAVDKIYIAAMRGNKNLLERQPNGRWTLNKKYEARQDKINLLLTTMRRLDVKRPADKAARNTAIRDIATLGKKVEVYQNGKLAKVFHVGETTDNDRGTYFIMEGSETPYVLHIPGFEGFLNTRFDVSEFEWRSVPVFRSSAQTIKELEVSYPPLPKNGYKITRTGDGFSVDGLQDVDQENLVGYLNNFRFINGEFFFPNTMNRMSDSLALIQPVARISITDVNPMNSKKISLYEKPNTVNDHLIALNEKTKEVMQVQTYVFDRVLVRKDAFRKNSASAAK